MGQLGEAFENAPKPDQQKLVKVERSKSPIEPLESKELMEKFTRPKGDQFYNQINYVRFSNYFGFFAYRMFLYLLLRFH